MSRRHKGIVVDVENHLTVTVAVVVKISGCPAARKREHPGHDMARHSFFELSKVKRAPKCVCADLMKSKLGVCDLE